MANKSGAFTEAQVIAALKEIFATTDPRISIGIGDDAAVVSGGNRQILTTDMAVEGVHFRTDWSNAFEIGRKVTAANCADVLAMSGTTDYLLVAVALTGGESMMWISDLARGIKYEADLAGAQVVGGDISRANSVVISITAVGSTVKAIARIGAKAGDGIYLSSLTGWSAAGLAIMESKFTSATDAHAVAVREYKNPTIDYSFDSTKATAMCDVSDALLEQATQMAEASGVQFTFDEKLIAAMPEFADLNSVANDLNQSVWQFIFAGGEDHALLATGNNLPGLRIGEVQSGYGLSGVPTSVKTKIWKHFN
jgi:thiamine-monophosphate kinase